MPRNTILNLIPRLVQIEGHYGVEIEAEGRNLPLEPGNLWTRHQDGSLQAGAESAEYVMPVPSSLEGVYKALDQLEDSYRKNNTKILESQTSGVHVHVNVQQYTPKQLFTFIVTYFILEELLLKFCGPSREGNHFCLRGKDAEYIIYQMCLSAQSQKIGNLRTDNLRYCSLNPVSLFKYGSIEFRAMRGTGDLNSIKEWVEIIDQVRKGAQDFQSPDEVVRLMSVGGPVMFIRSILRNKAQWFLDNVPNHKELIKEGVRLTQPLAYATDWDEYKDEKINPFRKEV